MRSFEGDLTLLLSYKQYLYIESQNAQTHFNNIINIFNVCVVYTYAELPEVPWFVQCLLFASLFIMNNFVKEINDIFHFTFKAMYAKMHSHWIPIDLVGVNSSEKRSLVIDTQWNMFHLL